MLDVEDEASRLKSAAQKQADDFLSKSLNSLRKTEEELDILINKEIQSLSQKYIARAEVEKKKFIDSKKKEIYLDDGEISSLASLAVEKLLK